MELNEMVKYSKVMVIDDTNIDRIIAEKVIKKFGTAEDVLSFDSAKDALQYLMLAGDDCGKLPQIIFVDVNMPEMNGFEFLSEYGRLCDSITRNCLVMMLTSSLHPGDKDQLIGNRHVFRFINKPLTGEKIKEAEELAVQYLSHVHTA